MNHNLRLITPYSKAVYSTGETLVCGLPHGDAQRVINGDIATHHSS